MVLEARLEDLTVRVVEKVKTTKKGSKAYTYWTASWRESGKVHNVHLGSSRKLSRQAALQKARNMTAESLGTTLLPVETHETIKLGSETFMKFKEADGWYLARTRGPPIYISNQPIAGT